MLQLVVFDIDGTLVQSADFDSELYARAIQEVLDLTVDTDWSKYEHVTDSGILREVLEASDWRVDRQQVEAHVESRFVQLTREYVDRNPYVLREVPGSRALLDALRRSTSVRVAIATGGWRQTAVLKLSGIGIDPGELALATGSDAQSRCEIMEIAEHRALNGLPVSKKTLFGDGVWDKKAAEELAYEFIAVGDGVDHHSKIPDLSDVTAILTQLGVPPNSAARAGVAIEP